MTAISKEDVRRLARLAHLKLGADEVTLYQKELAVILSFINQLQALDVEGLPATAQVTNLKNTTRPDNVSAKLPLKTKDLEQNGLEFEDGQIKVDRVVF